MRRRTCDDEGKGCDGKHVQLKLCNTHSCVLGNENLTCNDKIHLTVNYKLR